MIIFIVALSQIQPSHASLVPIRVTGNIGILVSCANLNAPVLNGNSVLGLLPLVPSG